MVLIIMSTQQVMTHTQIWKYFHPANNANYQSILHVYGTRMQQNRIKVVMRSLAEVVVYMHDNGKWTEPSSEGQTARHHRPV